MAYHKLDSKFRVIAPEALDAWSRVPTSVASDCMNRTQSMDAEIKSVKNGSHVCGQARTVTAMIGDGGAVHVALETCMPGEVIVVSAGEAKNVAIWGGVGHFAAEQRDIGGLVIDGAIRDVADIRASTLPCFCRAVTPRGPHLEFGGTVGAVTSVGNVPVAPGDLVIGDDDGVVVVPLEKCDEILELALNHLELEKEWLKDIESGKTVCHMFGLPNGSE